MKDKLNAARKLQEQYYNATVNDYDKCHVASEKNSEHDFAMMYMSIFIKKFNVKSILDVGSGTGRLIQYIKLHYPNIKIVGVEPNSSLRMIGYEKGISINELIDGDGNDLQFKDNSFDIVCEFGMLHHVPRPDKIVSEMLRVSKIGIFISDSNNFGQGSSIARKIKQVINFLKIWQLFNYIITKGKIYHCSEGDGIFYSYSIFNDILQIKKNCNKIYLTNTVGEGINLYRENSHIALFAQLK